MSHEDSDYESSDSSYDSTCYECGAVFECPQYDITWCWKCNERFCNQCMPDECKAGTACNSWTDRPLCQPCFKQPRFSKDGYCLKCLPPPSPPPSPPPPQEESIAMRTKKRQRSCNNPPPPQEESIAMRTKKRQRTCNINVG